MSDKIEKVLDSFLEDDKNKTKNNDERKYTVIKNNNDELIENINRKLITEDGRVLLRD